MTQIPDILIFTHASPDIGHGHVSRCRSLAWEGRRRGKVVNFITEDSYTTQLLKSWGETPLNSVDECPPSPFIIRDFRNPNPITEVQKQITEGATVLLLDDLGPARTLTLLVVDAMMTPQRSVQHPHSSQTQYLYGLPYAPLHQQFAEHHRRAKPGLSASSRLFVSFGGSDPQGITYRFLQALDQVGFSGPATVVIEPIQETRQQVTEIVKHWHQVEILENVTDMAHRMSACDLVATKLGVTLFEAFCVGLGCVLIEPTPAHVQLQEDLAQAHQLWPVIEFGLANEVDFRKAAQKTVECLQDSQLLTQLGQQGANLIDGLGVKRIMDELLGFKSLA